VGTLLKDLLSRGLKDDASVEEVRGVGMMIGVEMRTPALMDAVANLCFERGLLVLECGKKTIRFSPPLNFSAEQAATAAEVFVRACKDARP
jgi:4-aminobutyrate aminotransferase